MDSIVDVPVSQLAEPGTAEGSTALVDQPVTERVERTATRRIFLVDDHPVVRRGLVDLLGNERGLAVCGEAADIPSALEGIRRTKPDLVLVDISLKSASGLDLIRAALALDPELRVLVLSMRDELVYAERALQAGALGYVHKEVPSGQIIEAVHAVLEGRVHLSERMAGRALSRLVGRGSSPLAPAVDDLTNRELEVFELIGRGYTTRRIAERLQRSVKTIESHRENIKSKLGVTTGTELIRRAVKWVEESS